MAFDNHTNLAYALVATAPSPATSGTSLVVTAGFGSTLGTPPFNMTVWATGVAPTASNAEIVRVTNISTDTLTITRTQEGTSARAIIIGDQIAVTATAKVFTDIENFLNGTTTAPILLAPQITGANGNLSITAATDGGQYNIFSANGNQTLAIYGSSSNTLNVSILDGNLTLGAGSITLSAAGAKINIGTGSNASAGTGTLSSGTAIISTTAVTSSSLIFLTDTASSLTNVGTLSVSAKSAGVSFTVTSANALDGSTFNWFLIN